MKVIIPVAGVGTRLRPHTLTQPKVLLNIAGHPMIYHIINQLIQDRIATNIILITGFMGDKIENYLNKAFKFKFDFVEQKEPLGLGHAIYCAKEKFDPIKKEDVLIILGDTLFDVNLKDMCKNKYSVIGVKKVDDPRRFGVVEKNGKGFIHRFVEKPQSKVVSSSNEAIVGLYFLKNSTLLFESLDHIIKNDIKTKNEFQLTDALETMIVNKDKMKTYNVSGWLDCGKPETMLETNRYILNKTGIRYSVKGSVIKYPVFIGENVTLENCVLGPDATINTNSVIKNSTIKNSIIGEHCHIDNSIISDSIVGKNCRVKNKKGSLNLGEYSEI
jgi:glucose-1-phosphate thymidylyltransferase